MQKPNLWTAAALLLASSLAYPSFVTGQEDSRDEAAIHDYLLSMPKIQTYAAAVKEYQAAGAMNQAIANECKGKLDDDHMALTAKQKVIESSCPQMNAWIQQHGLTAHDFLFIPMGLITAGLAELAVDRGAKPPAFVNSANIQFAKEHKAELEKLQIGSSED